MSRIMTIMGWFYVVTGMWPVVHLKSFEFISGPKTDKWLVKTLGLMITCSGVVFLVYSDHEATSTLALMNASVLAGIDIYYSYTRVIRKIYLLDAVVELIFIGLILAFKI